MMRDPLLPFIKRHPVGFAAINCFLASLFCVYEFILRVLPSPMVSALMAQFKTDAEGIGLLSAAFFMAYALMQIPVGLLYDTFSVRKLLTFSVFLCATGSVIFALSQVLWLATVGRVLTGAGASFAVIGTFLLISRWFPARYFSFITGLVQLMCAFGAILGQAPIAAVMSTGVPWYVIGLTVGIIGFVLAVVYFILIRNHPPNAHVSRGKPPGLKGTVNHLLVIAKSLRSWMIALYACFVWGPISVLGALWGIPFLVVTYHIGMPLASEAIAMVWVGVAIGSPIIGWLSYRLKNKWIFMVGGPAISFIVTMVIIFANSLHFWLMYILLFIFGFAAGVLPLSFMSIKENNPKRLAGTAIGFNNMAVVLGGSLFQPLVGNILQANWQSTYRDNVPYYTLVDYHHALLILPGSAAACTLLAVILMLTAKKGNK